MLLLLLLLYLLLSLVCVVGILAVIRGAFKLSIIAGIIVSALAILIILF